MISRSEMIFIYVISTNLVDIDSVTGRRGGTRMVAFPGASLMGAQNDNVVLFKNKQLF